MTVKAQDLPKPVEVMEKAAETLRQTGGQVEQERWVGASLMVSGLILGGTRGAVGAGLPFVARAPQRATCPQ